MPDLKIGSVLLTENRHDAEPDRRDFQLEIEVPLDEKSLIRLKRIVEKHGFLLDRKRDWLVIYSPRSKPTGMELLA